MSSRRRRDPAEVARQTMARSDRRQQFLNYLQARNLPRNEENAHLYAFSLGLGSRARVNLVHELLEGMRLDEIFTPRNTEE